MSPNAILDINIKGKPFKAKFIDNGNQTYDVQLLHIGSQQVIPIKQKVPTLVILSFLKKMIEHDKQSEALKKINLAEEVTENENEPIVENKLTLSPLFSIFTFFGSEAREKRKQEREKQKRQYDEHIRFLQLEKAEEKRREFEKYKELRKLIEQMPQYEHWKKAVFDKFGRKCAVCGSEENIEVDHRYKSFYAIVREYRITNTIQAYECSALWDINNGAPLCKLHHDQTKSSIYHQQNNF